MKKPQKTKSCSTSTGRDRENFGQPARQRAAENFVFSTDSDKDVPTLATPHICEYVARAIAQCALLSVFASCEREAFAIDARGKDGTSLLSLRFAVPSRRLKSLLSNFVLEAIGDEKR